MKQKLSVAPTLKNYDKKNLPKDILAGIIIMAVSIPISMGYAQISGFFYFFYFRCMLLEQATSNYFP